MSDIVSEKDFNEKLLPEIPVEHRERAKKLFTDCGEALSVDIVLAIILGLEHDKLPYALTELEAFYEKHVKNDDKDTRLLKVAIFYYGEYLVMIKGRISGQMPIVAVGDGVYQTIL